MWNLPVHGHTRNDSCKTRSKRISWPNLQSSSFGHKHQLTPRCKPRVRMLTIRPEVNNRQMTQGRTPAAEPSTPNIQQDIAHWSECLDWITAKQNKNTLKWKKYYIHEAFYLVTEWCPRQYFDSVFTFSPGIPTIILVPFWWHSPNQMPNACPAFHCVMARGSTKVIHMNQDHNKLTINFTWYFALFKLLSRWKSGWNSKINCVSCCLLQTDGRRNDACTHAPN